MKKSSVIILVLGLLISYGLYQVYVFKFDDNDNIQSIYLVPKDAVYILETQNPIDNWDAISKSKVWQHLNTNAYFNDVTKSLNKLDTIFKQKQGTFNRIGNREVLVSAHVYAPKKYSFLYVVDLQKIAKLNLLKNNLNTLINKNYKVSKRKYHNHEITEIYDLKTRETLSISFIKNQVIASYVHTLIEASIDQYQEPSIGRNLSFIEVKKEVGYNDMFRLYFQYEHVEQLVKVFSNTQSKLSKTLKNSLDFSGFSFDLNENTIVANGITNTNNKATTYLKALQKSGKGTRQISNVAPKETALYLSFAFENFKTFYSNFESIQKESPEQFKTYLDGTEKIENFLNINIKDHFFSWIDDEIALLQLHSNVSKSKKDVALVLKANAITKASHNLNFILEQIRKRTPVKFKAVNYKGHTIKFMAIKGFFKTILGDLFAEIEKPYYTIIDDYVIFSNEPNTLKSIINSYTNNETLAHFEAFKTFDKKLENSSSLSAYINTPSLYNSAYNFVDNVSKKQLKINKDYFICFPMVGIQLTPDEDYFESKIVIEYQDPETVKINYNFSDTLVKKINKTVATTAIPEDQINTNTVFNIPEIYPTDLTAKNYSEKHANGNISFTVDLKDGLKHGRYKAYYKNGDLKISGKYKKDKQVSTWRVYDLKENMVFKKRF